MDAKSYCQEAAKALGRAEKELDLTYRSAYNIPKNAIALERWYDDMEIIVMHKEGLPPFIVSDSKPPLTEEWGEGVIKTSIRISGVWQ